MSWSWPSATSRLSSDDEIAVLRLRRQRHLEAELANLLVEARREHSRARAVGLAAADEDRRAAVAVTSRAAALLAAELLAGASNVAALAGRTRRSATVDELPGDDAVKDVGARLDGENLVVELDVAASLGGSRVCTLTFILAFLALVGFWASPRAAGAFRCFVLGGSLGSRPRQPHRLPAQLRSPRLPHRSEAPGSRGPRRRRPGRPRAASSSSTLRLSRIAAG